MVMGGEKRRVLMLGLPRMLAELVGHVVAQDDRLAVVGDVTEEQAPAAVLRTQPDFVIVGGDQPMPPDSCVAAFESRPHLVVLALAGNGRHGVLWELAPRREALGELAPDSLLSALREAREWTWDG